MKLTLCIHLWTFLSSAHICLLLVSTSNYAYDSPSCNYLFTLLHIPDSMPVTDTGIGITVPCKPWPFCEGIALTFLNLWHWMEFKWSSSRPSHFKPEVQVSDTIKQQSGRALKPALGVWSTEKSLLAAGNRTLIPRSFSPFPSYYHD